jgi:hypothetical protein
VVTMKSSVLCDISPRSPLKVNRRFERICLHLPGRKISRACYLLHTDFLLGLFFDPEDEGYIFLRNVG